MTIIYGVGAVILHTSPIFPISSCSICALLLVIQLCVQVSFKAAVSCFYRPQLWEKTDVYVNRDT